MPFSSLFSTRNRFVILTRTSRPLHHVTILSLFLIALFLGSAAVAASGMISAASTTSTNPAATQVNPTSPITMKGFTQVGSLPPSFPVIVTVAVPLNNLALLQSIEVAISNPLSPQYRDFLSQQTIQQLFLPISKYKSTLSYLESQGFTIVTTAEDSIIVATATVAQLHSSLGLNTILYSNGTYSYYSASGSPSFSGVYVYSSNVTGLVLQNNLVVSPSSSFSLGSTNTPQVSQSFPNVTSPIEAYQAPDLLSTYNASTLVSSGNDGKGKGIGILEFGGDTYIPQELAAYDQETGLPAPPSFNIVPVGPYNPNIGVVAGVPGEEALDVESSHAMAPGANITVYTGNFALNFAPVIAVVDQQDVVNVFSQSWFVPEMYFSYLGPSFFTFNVVLGDQYYLLGSVEGITFTDASGDRGGTGFAGQPLGSQGWPATSPYVTAVGGTTTYLTFSTGQPGSNVVSSYQTAWSNQGFEPTLANFGGGTGGVSSIETKPWYQNSIATPNSYVNGRITPDVSLNANVFPAIFEVLDSRTVSSTGGFTTSFVGGTSEAAPLLAGLLVDIDQKISGTLGLINPSLYQIGESPSLYPKEFTPITFGYNSPWVSSSGYNLVTGWGAPNIGAWSDYFSSATPGSTPSIQVNILNSAGGQQFEFTAGQKIVVSAVPSDGLALLSSTPLLPQNSAFTAELVTLQGTLVKVPLTFSTALNVWQGKITVPDTASGMSDVVVNGTVGGTQLLGLSGMQIFGFAQVFTGYIATITSPIALPGSLPWSTLLGLNVNAIITDLNGNPITAGDYSFAASSYSISTNTYTPFVNEKLKLGPSGVWSGPLTGDYPTGPVNIVLNEAFGFISFMNGVALTPTFIVPPINVEPGTVSPGQFLTIDGELQAPENTPALIGSELGLPISEEIQIGSNLTASLVSPSGQVVSTVNVGAIAVPTTFSGFPVNYLGYLQVPSDAAAGIYTILLSSTYQSIDLGLNFNGSYFGQVLVAGQSAIVPTITLTPNPVAEGQNVQIQANIAYANGTEVKNGMYAATLYPAYDSNHYASYSALPAGQIPLWYDPSLNMWIGNVTMPSPTSLGFIGGYPPFDTGLFPGIVSQPVSGPWDAYVSGVSADGVPTTTNESAQQSFTVSPDGSTVPSVSSGQSSSAPTSTSNNNNPSGTEPTRSLPPTRASKTSIFSLSSNFLIVGAILVSAVSGGLGFSVIAIRRAKNNKKII